RNLRYGHSVEQDRQDHDGEEDLQKPRQGVDVHRRRAGSLHIESPLLGLSDSRAPHPLPLSREGRGDNFMPSPIAGEGGAQASSESPAPMALSACGRGWRGAPGAGLDWPRYVVALIKLTSPKSAVLRRRTGSADQGAG